MRPIFRLVMMAAALCSGCAGLSIDGGYGERARVLSVSDGDTITVVSENGTGDPRSVRVIGVNTPEVWEKEGGKWRYVPKPCGPEASYRTHELTDGTVVTLERDRFNQGSEKYGRDLYHVRLADGRLLSFVLISEGLGRYESYGHPVMHEAALRAAEALADGCLQRLKSSRLLGYLTPGVSEFFFGAVFDEKDQCGEAVSGDVRDSGWRATREQVGEGLQSNDAGCFVYTLRLFIGHDAVPS